MNEPTMETLARRLDPRRRIIGGIVAVAILSASSTNAAECAWVLWEKIEQSYFYRDKKPEFSTSWELISAHPSWKKCLIVQEAVWRSKVDNYKDLSQLKGVKEVQKVYHTAVFVTLKEKKNRFAGNHNFFFYCLPDTIDPRSPKQ